MNHMEFRTYTVRAQGKEAAKWRGLQKRLKGKVLINSECVARLEAR